MTLNEKQRITLKEHIKHHYGVETPKGLRWHKTPKFDPEYIYNNFDKLSNKDLKRLLKDSIYNDIV